MTAILRLTVSSIAAVVLMTPGVAWAAPGPLSAASRTPAGLEATKVLSQRRSASATPSVVRGALIGAGAALVATGMAASKYGENEGGRFCSRCLAQWSLFTVPAGAGIGAAIGYGIHRLRRSVAAAPLFSAGRRGIVVMASF